LRKQLRAEHRSPDLSTGNLTERFLSSDRSAVLYQVAESLLGD
jgi:hypothetical protein